jgi:hypothetical protein
MDGTNQARSSGAEFVHRRIDVQAIQVQEQIDRFVRNHGQPKCGALLHFLDIDSVHKPNIGMAPENFTVYS